MPRIRTYGTDSVIQDADLLLGSDSLYQFETVNFSVGAIKSHILTSTALTYVPYTGATGDINIGTNNIYTFGGAKLWDDGTVEGMTFQFVNASNSYISASATATRNWQLPDQSGTIALLSDIGAANTLNDVLTSGNSSLIAANVESIGLADPFNGNAYGRVEGSKNRINFFGSTSGYLGYIGLNTLSLLSPAGGFQISIKGPDALTANRTVKFQDKDGVVAYLSDVPPGPITTPTLNDVLTSGNASLVDANVGNEFGIYDPVGLDYAKISVADKAFTFTDWQLDKSVYFEQGLLSLYKTNAINGTINAQLLSAGRNYNLPNASGTIALTSDIPAAQVNSDWNETNTSSKAFILNKPAIATTPVDTTYFVQGGTAGVQPTFNGQPLFTASYVQTGDLVFFRINVDMSNITSFGTGQYYMTLPFNAKYDMIVSSGHLNDNSANDNYQLSGEITAGSNVMWLYYIASNSQLAAFDYNSPKVLDLNDYFHISGSYIKQ
jgi:hypothetical protein